MSGLKGTGSRRKSTAKKKPEVHELKAAFILPKEEGEKMVQALGELPSKYYQTLVGPMLEAFGKAFRGDTTVTIDPNKPGPPVTGQAPKNERSDNELVTNDEDED